MKASVIIPAWNHGRYLAAAIDSCLAQTVPVEIIVVDDESDDQTFGVMARYSSRIVGRFVTHGGVARARNIGLQMARGEFVCFLDADDVIAPHKIEKQLLAFARWPEADWIICDTLIVDEISRKTERASERYGYPADFPSNLAPLLAERNFIPVHAPLVRRSVIADIEFPEGRLEDWAFWRMVANVAPARYVDDVLCTYHKRPTGRNSQK